MSMTKVEIAALERLLKEMDDREAQLQQAGHPIKQGSTRSVKIKEANALRKALAIVKAEKENPKK